MGKDELQVLLQAAERLNIDPSLLKPLNPWTQKGPRAEAMRMAVEEVSPSMAARWRVESGEEMSLATVAAEAGIIPHTQSSYEDLITHDAVAADMHIKKQQDWEAEILKSMESKAMKLATARGVDPDAMNQPHNSAITGKFKSYFDNLNAEAAREQAAKNNYQPRI